MVTEVEKLVEDVDSALNYIEEFVMLDLLGTEEFTEDRVQFVDFPAGEMVVMPVFCDLEFSEDDNSYAKVKCWSISENEWGFDVLTVDDEVKLSYVHKGKVNKKSVLKSVKQFEKAGISNDFVYGLNNEELEDEAEENPRVALCALKLSEALNEIYETEYNN